MRFNSYRAVLTISLTVLALLPIIETMASSAEMIGVAPAVVSIKMSKDAPRIFTVNVINNSAKPMKVETTLQDFSLDPDGHVIFLKARRKKRPWSAASWLRVPKKDFSVSPRSEKILSVIIAQPKNAEFGTHRALVTFSTFSRASKKAGEPEVQIKASVSVVVLVEVEGKATADPNIVLEVPKYNFVAPKIHVSLGNRGNVHYFALGDLQLKDSNEKIKKIFPLKHQSPGALVLPSKKRVFDRVWRGAPYFGSYSAKAIVKITGKQELLAEKHFYVIRWQLLVSICAFLIIIMFVYYLLTRFQLVKKPKATNTNQD